MERVIIYVLVILNVSLGFYLFYGEFGRFKAFDYRYYLKKQEKKEAKSHGKKRN